MEKDHQKHDEEAKQGIVKHIEEYGYSICLFEATDYIPSFAYSIGFFESYGHPEIICFGLPLKVLSAVIHDAHKRIQNGTTLEVHKKYDDFLQDYKVTFLDVTYSHKRDWFGYAQWYYGTRDFPCMQMVWPDKQHLFPWEKDFNPDWIYKQFLLDRNEDFKFREPRNLGVISSTDFFKHSLDITTVVHDDEGDWWFVTENGASPSATGLYAIESVIKKDLSLNELFNLEYGKKATREKKGDPWVITDFEYDTDEEE